MRLTTLRMKNFRQFFGETPTLRLSGSDRKVTVFHGSNGAGKTALLNVFTWALYESFTPGFQYPEQLVNKKAIREAGQGDSVEAWVELAFEHDDRKYVLKRSIEVLRTADDPGWVARGPSKVTLQSCGVDGKWHDIDRVSDAIGRVLPADLHSYFFFDGERIERIVQSDKKEQKALGEATKKLLGVEVLVRAQTHLNRVRRDLEKELEAIGDAETKRLLEEKAGLESSLEKTDERCRELERNIEADKVRQAEIEERLRRLEDVKAIQARRDQLNRDSTSRQTSLRQTRTDIASLISKDGYTVFLKTPMKSFRDLVESLKNRGELPAGIKRNFVAALLDERRCICGTKLTEGTGERHSVEEWREKAGLADVEEKAIRMGGEVAQIEQSVPTALERLDQMQQRNATDRAELARIEDELDDIREKLQSSPKEEISALERRRESLAEKIETQARDLGSCEREKRDLEERIEALGTKISKHKTQELKQRVAQARVDAAIDARDRIADVHRRLETVFRSNLTRRVKDLFGTMSVTPYVPELTRDWSLRLLESAGGSPLPVAASQGESQILSLAFIASIIELAREQQAQKEKLPGPNSAVYPVVMDSPFGSLDPVYRHQVAEHVPRIADQVLLMVTKTQWRGEVEQSLQDKVAHQYVLTYFTPRDDVKETGIDLRGQTYDLVKRSPNEFEYTEISEVPHGRP